MDLAYAYRESGDTEKANEIYSRVTEEFAGTQNAADAAGFLADQ